MGVLSKVKDKTPVLSLCSQDPSVWSVQEEDLALCSVPAGKGEVLPSSSGGGLLRGRMLMEKITGSRDAQRR